MVAVRSLQKKNSGRISLGLMNYDIIKRSKMKTIEQLQKENNILVAALDDHRNFIWHLRDSQNASKIERFLEENRQLDVYVDCLKAQAIDEVRDSPLMRIGMSDTTYDKLTRYANNLRGEK